jgi:hypothetical protein
LALLALTLNKLSAAKKKTKKVRLSYFHFILFCGKKKIVAAIVLTFMHCPPRRVQATTAP